MDQADGIPELLVPKLVDATVDEFVQNFNCYVLTRVMSRDRVRDSRAILMIVLAVCHFHSF